MAIRTIFLGNLFFFVVACGGGSGGGNDSEPTSELTAGDTSSNIAEGDTDTQDSLGTAPPTDATEDDTGTQDSLETTTEDDTDTQDSLETAAPTGGDVGLLVSSLPAPSGSGEPVASNGVGHAYGQWIGPQLFCATRDGSFSFDTEEFFNEDGTYSQMTRFTTVPPAPGTWGVFDIEYSDGGIVPMLFFKFDSEEFFEPDPYIETLEGDGIGLVTLMTDENPNGVSREELFIQAAEFRVCEI